MESSSRVSGSRLPERFRDRLRLPVIAAPMLHVSGPDLVVAACRAGVIGAFPTMNPRVLHADGGLDGWLSEIRCRLSENAGASGPVCPNLIMRADDLDDHVDTILRHFTYASHSEDFREQRRAKAVQTEPGEARKASRGGFRISELRKPMTVEGAERPPA